MKMAEGITVGKDLNKFNTITNQLTKVGINFDDKVRALLILSFLSKSWDVLVMAIRNFSSLSTLKFDDVVSILLNKEIRRKLTVETSSSGSTLTIKEEEELLREGKTVEAQNLEDF